MDKSFFDFITKSSDESLKNKTMQALGECVLELQDRVLKLESVQEKNELDACDGCYLKAKSIDAMISLLLPILNSDDPIVGNVAMSVLLTTYAIKADISKDAFLHKMSLYWNKVIEECDGEDDDE